MRICTWLRGLEFTFNDTVQITRHSRNVFTPDPSLRETRNNQNKNKKLENVTKNSKFFSGKYLVEGGKEYLSYAHWKKNLDNSNIVIDTPEYWDELDHFYIYEQN